MEGTVTAHEAKMKFGDLLARVSNGEEIVITRNGLPAARIIPEGTASRNDIAAFIDAMLERRKSRLLNSPGESHISIRELIEEGRK